MLFKTELEELLEEDNQIVEILGEGLDTVMSKYTKAVKTFQGDLASRENKEFSWNTQVWEITNKDLDRLHNIADWLEDYGWFRHSKGSILGPCTKTNITINSKPIITWGHTKEVIEEAWEDYIKELYDLDQYLNELEEWDSLLSVLESDKKEHIETLIEEGNIDRLNIEDKGIILALKERIPTNYSNPYDYIGNNFRVSGEKNITSLLIDLAKYNKIKLSELLKNYGG